MNIALAIKKLRKDSNIKQYVMAKDIGITQSYLSGIEQGKKIPSISTLQLICDYLNKPMPVLLWFGLSIEDVPESKRDIFKSIKPSFDELLKSVFI